MSSICGPALFEVLVRLENQRSSGLYACHGKQNVGNPPESALLLDNDGKLSVECIMQHDMHNI